MADGTHKLTVYRLAEEGTLVKCDTTVADGKVIFATDHFSTFILAEETTAAGAPDTSDASASGMHASLICLLTGLAVIAGYAFGKRKKAR